MHLCSDMKTSILLVFSLVSIGIVLVDSSINELSQVDAARVKCSNLEFDSYYLDFLLIYKDNVKSYDECCEFCNSNTRCVVWTLKVDTGRCYLKYDRGAKLTDTGFVSGFSEKCKFSYFLPYRLAHSSLFSILDYSTLSTPIPFLKTTTTAVQAELAIKPKIEVKSASPFNSSNLNLYFKHLSPRRETLFNYAFLECELLERVEFEGLFIIQAKNVSSLALCCDFCSDFNMCASFTYYPSNQICLLFDKVDRSKKNCTDTFNGCISGYGKSCLTFNSFPSSFLQLFLN